VSVKLGHWRNKATGEIVLVIWQSDELVTYQTATKTLGPVRKFLFTQDYEVVEP